MLKLANCSIHGGGFNPLTFKHIYKIIGLPKALYGCELWNNLFPKHLHMLEPAHLFCVKYMPSLPKHTNTDLPLSPLDFQNIEFEIDYRKLIF